MTPPDDSAPPPATSEDPAAALVATIGGFAECVLKLHAVNLAILTSLQEINKRLDTLVPAAIPDAPQSDS